jgi:hypothetical protein
MTDKTYNDWTNYATRRVNLEIFDGLDPRDMGWQGLEPYDLAPILRDHAEEIIESTAPEGLARDYAMAFVDNVNYREIAELLLEAYAEEAA